MHWICHSANIIITFITIQPQPLSPSISSHEQPSQNTHTHPLWVLNPMQAARTAATFSHETIHDNHYFSLWHSEITMAGMFVFAFQRIFFSHFIKKLAELEISEAKSSAIQNNSVTLFAVSIGLLFVTLVNQCYKVIIISLTTKITTPIFCRTHIKIESSWKYTKKETWLSHTKREI